THVGTNVTLRRVDLGRIEEFYRELTRQGIVKPSPIRDSNAIVDAAHQVSPWLRVGGLVEVVEQIAADYDLRLSKGFVDRKAVWILRGVIKAKAKQRMTAPESGAAWSERCPHEVRMAIAAVGDENGFGVGLPSRIEFWGQPPLVAEPGSSDPAPFSDQVSSPPQTDATVKSGLQTVPASLPLVDSDELNTTDPSTEALPTDKPRGNLISLLEIYAVRRIQPSPEERFRFEREDRDVNFFNDTRHYLQRMTHQHAGLELP
ncbi:MAG TPA: hypothetical protein DDZ51_10435, partial [Planctomycetaceae bacterium]|nr:hypothetical protein [Planctomycetaceae bacterium]